MELLIKNREKLAMKGLGRFGFILLTACLLFLANTKTFAQIECAEKIEFTVQSIDESAEGVGDAKLVLSGVPANTYLVDYASGTTYAGTPSTTFGSLTAATETNTLGRYIATGLANPATPAGQQYTVRVQMPDNSCYSDSTIVLPRVNWSAEPDYTDLDVTVAKSGDATTVGTTVTVTVSVTNDDSNAGVNTVDATGVEIIVNEPATGLALVGGSSDTGGNGTFDEGTLIWNVGTVPAGTTYTLQLTYTVTERGVFQIGSEVKTTTGTVEELDSMPLDEGGGSAFEDEDDESSTCISTPWDWCTTDSFDFTLISDVYTGITWQKDGSDITASVPGEYTLNADGSLTILSVGSYNFRYDHPTNASCDAVGCCPIDIVQGTRPDLLEMPPAAICLNETLPTVLAQDDTAPGDYDSDRGLVVYQWFNDNGTDNPTTDTIVGQTALTLDLSTLPQTAGTYYYKLKALDELHTTCIDSTTFEFVITDIEKPIASSNTPICEEEQIELTVTNMTDYPGTDYDFNWWYEADSATTFAAIGDSVGILDADPVTHSGDYVVQVSQTFTSPFSSGSVDTYCAKTDTVTMLVNPLPAPPVMKDSTYCQFEEIAELIEHVVDSTGGDFISWYQTTALDPPFSTTAFASNKPDSSIAGQFGPYYVTQTDGNGCESYPDSFVVNINALPEPPVVQDLAYCEGATTTVPLTATPLSGDYTLTWYDDTLDTGAGGTPADPVIPTPDASAVDTLRFYVTQTFGTTSCESYNAELIVYIKDTPDRPGFDDPVYCLDDVAVSLDNHLTPSIASTTSPSDTYTHWTYPAFTDDGVAVPTPTTTDAGSSYGLVWEEWQYIAPDASTLSCEGPMEDLRVIVNPKPNIEPIAVNALCVGDAAQDDARLYITDYRDSDVLLWHAGSSFVAGSVVEAAQTGTDMRANGGAFASNLTNPTVGSGPTSYAIQITNEFGCVETGTVDLTEKDCVCPGGYCEPASITRTL